MGTLRIKKGDRPVSQAALERAKEAYMAARGWTMAWRDEAMLQGQLVMQGVLPGSPLYEQAMTDLANFKVAIAETRDINSFNRQLAAFRKAAARLARYRLADGRPEVTEDQPTGDLDDDGNPILVTVVVQTAIDPLPADVEVETRDPETGEVTGTEMIPNPAIVQDDAERAAAQAVVDQTPQEVKDWYASGE